MGPRSHHGLSIAELVGAFGESVATPRWLLVLGALAWIVAGVVTVMNPGAAAVTVGVLLGVLAIAWGVLTIAAGVALRSATKKAADTPTTV